MLGVALTERVYRSCPGDVASRGDMTMVGATQSWWDLARAAEPTGLKQNNPRLMDPGRR
jgi:hypothetical protein